MKTEKKEQEHAQNSHTLLDQLNITPFKKRVYTALLNVPKGSVVTYAELAELAGHPGAARAVGSAMRTNPYPITIPCHRVIKSSGELGQYVSGTHTKESLLKAEGVQLSLKKISPKKEKISSTSKNHRHR